MKKRRQIHTRLTSLYGAPLATCRGSQVPGLLSPALPSAGGGIAEDASSRAPVCLSVSFSFASCGTSVLAVFASRGPSPPKDTHPGLLSGPTYHHLSPASYAPPVPTQSPSPRPSPMPSLRPRGKFREASSRSLQRLPPAGHFHTHAPPLPWGLWGGHSWGCCSCDPEGSATTSPGFSELKGFLSSLPLLLLVLAQGYLPH